MFTLAVDCEPSAENYAGLIVSTSLAGDTLQAVGYVEPALHHRVNIDSLFSAIEKTTFSVGHASLYSTLLSRIGQTYTWLSRVTDRKLLAHYIFRNDGPAIVRYADIMLHGLPDDIDYLRIKARGQLLCADGDAAVATWRHILDLSPDHYQTLVDLANYYHALGDDTRALPLFRRVMDIRPTPYVESIIQTLSPDIR